MPEIKGVLIRNAMQTEHIETGQLMLAVYSQLPGFPKETEQPDYYTMLRNVGALTKEPETELIIAVNSDNMLLGAVVYFSNMRHYGSGGIATSEKNCGGFRLLAVDSKCRRQGIGKLLTMECIQRSKDKNHDQLIIHTTSAMPAAWKMYQGIGFNRSEDLDFMQGSLPVYGFRFFFKKH